jgi:hypothetical protein
MEFNESLLDRIEGTVFDETIRLYEHMKSDMMKNIVSDVMMDVKARSRPYRNDRYVKNKTFCPISELFNADVRVPWSMMSRNLHLEYLIFIISI